MGWRISFLFRALLVTAVTMLALKLVHGHSGHHHGEEKAQAAAPRAQPAHARHTARPGYRRTVQHYIVPDVALVTAQERTVKLWDLMAGDDPLLMNFIFTSCTTTCPVMNQALSALPQEIGPAAGKLRLVSVSVDPLQDTPAVLRSYAGRYRTRAPWHFLTGTERDIDAVRQAFGHDARHLENGEPLILLRVSAGAPWVRIEGYATAEELAREYRLAVKR